MSLAPQLHMRLCGRTAATGCLFNVTADPTESDNIAKDRKEDFEAMLARVDELQAGVFSPDRGDKDDGACKAALNSYGGYWGPWLE